jgi:hypothetical protein
MTKINYVEKKPFVFERIIVPLYRILIFVDILRLRPLIFSASYYVMELIKNKMSIRFITYPVLQRLTNE